MRSVGICQLTSAGLTLSSRRLKTNNGSDLKELHAWIMLLWGDAAPAFTTVVAALKAQGEGTVIALLVEFKIVKKGCTFTEQLPPLVELVVIGKLIRTIDLDVKGLGTYCPMSRSLAGNQRLRQQ